MASNEYSHCNNCRYWDSEKEFCKTHHQPVSKKGWCEKHFEKDPMNANDIAVEYRIRCDHMIMEMQGNKVKPIEEALKAFGWDGVERLKEGKFPEDKVESGKEEKEK